MVLIKSLLAEALPDWRLFTIAGVSGVGSRLIVAMAQLGPLGGRHADCRSPPPILVTLIDDLDDEERQHRMEEFGGAFARAFNEVNAQAGFIETEELDEANGSAKASPCA